MTPQLITVDFDPFSLLIINQHGALRRLYAPFRVICIKPADLLFEGVWVYVDGVFMDKQKLLLYHINGKNYPYDHFAIHIYF